MTARFNPADWVTVIPRQPRGLWLCQRCGLVPLLAFIETKGESAGICTPCVTYGDNWWTDRHVFEDVLKLRRIVPERQG